MCSISGKSSIPYISQPIQWDNFPPTPKPSFSTPTDMPKFDVYADPYLNFLMTREPLVPTETDTPEVVRYEDDMIEVTITNNGSVRLSNEVAKFVVDQCDRWKLWVDHLRGKGSSVVTAVGHCACVFRYIAQDEDLIKDYRFVWIQYPGFSVRVQCDYPEDVDCMSGSKGIRLILWLQVDFKNTELEEFGSFQVGRECLLVEKDGVPTLCSHNWEEE